MTTIGTFSHDDLISGDFPIVTKKVTVVSGELAAETKRGAILGIVTASGKARVVDSTNGDGSEVAEAILSEDIDASAGDIETIMYLSGQFNENKLTVGDSTVAARVAVLRAKSIFVENVIKEDGTSSS